MTLPSPARETVAAQQGPRKSTARVDDAATAPHAGIPSSAAQQAARSATEVDPPAGPSVSAMDPDADRVRQSVALFRKGDLAGGDALARAITNPIARLASEWAALRLQSRIVGLERQESFVRAHPDWSANPWIRRRIEEAAAARKDDITGSIDPHLIGGSLQTLAGKLSLARQDRARGQVVAATDVMSKVWRTEDLAVSQEGPILHEFGDLISKVDHKYRADHLLYKEQVAAATREAALAGPDMVLLAKARAAVIANTASDAAIAAVPKPLQTDPGLTFARIQKARRANKIDEATNLMLAAPRDPAALVEGDDWWTERRILARKLLDQGDAKRAYRVVAEHSAVSSVMKIEAEFHAGWIALRFIGDAGLAATHFTKASTLAETPISKARTAYWQGRAAEAARNDKADAFYRQAARFPITFYGQLAAAKVGQSAIALRSVPAAVGEARSDSVKVADYLFSIGARDVALPLALDVARNETSEAQVSAMGTVVEKARDAWATLAIGKTATQRGMALDETAFPTFGIPDFQPLARSADLAVVYAIARQESEFEQRSLSSAGAKGLMQMMPATAKRTADKAGVGYNDARLAGDAAFNAQLGAAHLGELLGEQGGSYILTFAAYNAGGKNVKDWIDAYGDPRKPGVDPVDWIERIPFTETRNYVQRVMENLQVYRAKLGHATSLVMGTGDVLPSGKGT